MSGCTQQPDARAWRVAAVASLLAHAAVGTAVPFVAVGIEGEARTAERRGEAPEMLLAWTPPPVPPPSPLPLPPLPTPPVPPPTPAEPEVVLGTEDSASIEGTALGFAEPTPHAAPESTVEQPALDPAAGVPGADAVVQPLLPAPEPVAESLEVGEAGPPGMSQTAPPVAEPEREPQPEDLAEREADQRPAEAEAVAARAPFTDESEAAASADVPNGLVPERDLEPIDPALPVEGQPSPAIVDHPVAPGESVPEERERVEPETSEVPTPETALPERPLPIPEPAPAPAETFPTESTPPSPLAASPAGSGDRPAEPSEKEADPSALAKPVEIRPGRPKSAAGLDITTKRPVFTQFVRSASRGIPDNPVLSVTFDRAGRVRSAAILKSSGIEDVDSPVLAAVYKWSAKGKALTELPSNDPKAGITMTVTILLR